MKTILFSRHFPKGHPKAGQPTWFVEKVEACLADIIPGWEMSKTFTLHEWEPYYNCTMPKGHTIRVGSRWKVGDMASLRVWSGAPYRTKQIEFAQVEVKKVWQIEIYQNEQYWQFNLDGKQVNWEQPDFNIDQFVDELAKNDGLTTADFLNWFTVHPKKKDAVFRGQIICWNAAINYTGKPDYKQL